MTTADDAEPPRPQAPDGRGLGVRESWLYTWGGLVLYAVLIYALTLMFVVVTSPGVSAGLVVFMGSTAAAFTGYVLFTRVYKAGLWAQNATLLERLMLLVPAGVVVVVSVLDPRWTLVGLIPPWIAISALSINVPRRAAVPVQSIGLVLAAGQLLSARAISPATAPEIWAAQLPALSPTFFMVLLTPGIIFFSVWWWGIIERLDRARAAESDLAVTRERLRFASDLHDIQGHHLQVIALKAELAERLLDRDLDAARVQLRETREEARAALDQTRALVHGLRQVSLSEELANAADVLTSAGIQSQYSGDLSPSSPESRRLLGLVTREATTNILRHAKPTTASYRLLRDSRGDLCLTVTNDGVRNGHVPPAGDHPGGRGSGLDSLRERLREAGGDLSVTRGEDSFTVTATLPDDTGPDTSPAATTPEDVS